MRSSASVYARTASDACRGSVPLSAAAAPRPPALQHLPAPLLAPLGCEGLAVDEPRIQLLAPQRVLEALGQPVQHRRDHVDVEVVANLAAAYADIHELERAVGILAP